MNARDFNAGVDACLAWFRDRRPVTATPFYLENLEKLKKPEEPEPPRPRPYRTHTHTFSVLEVSAQTFHEVKFGLESAGWDQALIEDSEGPVLDLSGVALAEKK